MMAGILTATYMGLSTRAPPRIIVVGGGLAGLSAAHTVLQNGGRVVLVDKEDKLGGNSMKASSGINSAGSYVQQDLQVPPALPATGRALWLRFIGGIGGALSTVLARC